MAAAPVPNEKLKDAKASRRRRKKRRTEDFSSDSESSSSSSSDEESNDEIENKSVNIDDIDVDSEDETNVDGINKHSDNVISAETQAQIKNIKFTSTSHSANKSPEEIETSLKKDKAQLEQEFLGLMASTFSEDLDELRKKPDFTEKSLVTLAKVLQSGSNIFDEDALDALLS